MKFFDAQTQLSLLANHLAAHDGMIVACYCAAWCDTCSEYRPGFEALAQRSPQHLFIWIDIEENETLLGDEEVENFPTLLIQSQQGNHFFGPMPPHPEHLERLMQAAADTAMPVINAGPGSLVQLVAAAAQ